MLQQIAFSSVICQNDYQASDPINWQNDIFFFFLQFQLSKIIFGRLKPY